MTEGKPKEDIKQRQLRGEYAEVLTEYADRYKRELHLGDRYMAANFFEEMFGTASRIVNEEQPDLPIRAKLARISGLLHDALNKVGANDEFADEFDRNFELCTVKLVPSGSTRHLKSQAGQGRGG